MKLKGRSILVLALLIFGGYAVFDFFHDKSKEEKAIQDSRLLTLDYDQINSVEIQKGSTKISLAKSIEGWSLTEPLQDKADNSIVDDFVNNLVPEKIIEIAIEGETIDWSRYGLKEPFATLTVKTNSGDQNVFEISEKKNFEDNLFLRKDHQNRVLIVNSNWLGRARKTVNDFRDLHLLRQKIAAVDSIHLKNEKGLIDLNRVNGKWEASTQKGLKLDQNKIRELLTVISDAKGSEVMEDLDAGAAQKILLSMDLKLADKTWKATFSQAKDLKIYGKVSDPAHTYKMESGSVDKLLKMILDDLKELPPKKEDNKTSGEKQKSL